MEALHLGDVVQQGACFHPGLIQLLPVAIEHLAKAKGHIMDDSTVLNDMRRDSVLFQEGITFIYVGNHLILVFSS
jgi:hypothetical protein